MTLGHSLFFRSKPWQEDQSDDLNSLANLIIRYRLIFQDQKIALNMFYAWMLGRDIPCRLYERRIDIPIETWDEYDVQIMDGLDAINDIFHANFQERKW